MTSNIQNVIDISSSFRKEVGGLEVKVSISLVLRPTQVATMFSHIKLVIVSQECRQRNDSNKLNAFTTNEQK